MSAMLRVRPAESRDTEPVHRLCHSISPDDYVLRAWGTWLATPGDLNLVAEIDGRLIGCVHGGPQIGGGVFSQALRVEPGSRRAGLARELMEALRRVARSLGLPFLCGVTGVTNDPARSFFSKIGFREIAQIARRSHLDWSGRSSTTSRLDTEITPAAIEALVGGALFSRPGLAIFRRLYFAPSAAWIAEAVRRGHLLANSGGAWVQIDEKPEESGLWIGAMGGPPEAIGALLESLDPGDDPLATLTLEAPADVATQELLDTLGFERSPDLGRYVIVERPTDSSTRGPTRAAGWNPDLP